MTCSRNDESSWNDIYNNLTAKELKRRLHELKASSGAPEEIVYVSKLLRRKLDKSKNDRCENVCDDLHLRDKLKTSFWKTCDKIFKPVINCIPQFTITTCFEYFSNILKNKTGGRNFEIPSWIPGFSDPTSPFNSDEPTYAEVAKAIRKSKSKASPCPFDGISVIVLKRCPFLRTILHRIYIRMLEDE